MADNNNWKTVRHMRKGVCSECKYTHGEHRATCSRGYCNYCHSYGHIEEFEVPNRKGDGTFIQIVCPEKQAIMRIQRALQKKGKPFKKQCLFCKAKGHIFYGWQIHPTSGWRIKKYLCPEYLKRECMECGEIGHSRYDHCLWCGKYGGSCDCYTLPLLRE